MKMENVKRFRKKGNMFGGSAAPTLASNGFEVGGLEGGMAEIIGVVYVSFFIASPTSPSGQGRVTDH